jgi:predicted GNAT family acetyltransferase
MDETKVSHNEKMHRFELNENSGAHLNYILRADALVFTHTEVPDAMQGKGAGGELARAGLEYARRHNLRVVPQCPFVSAYIQRHPEFADLVR